MHHKLKWSLDDADLSPTYPGHPGWHDTNRIISSCVASLNVVKMSTVHRNLRNSIFPVTRCFAKKIVHEPLHFRWRSGIYPGNHAGTGKLKKYRKISRRNLVAKGLGTCLPIQGILKGGSITLPLTSCLTGLELAVWQLTIFVFICKTD